MIVHLDRELFHNKLLHKTLGFPFLGPGPQPRTRCNGPVILPKLYPICKHTYMIVDHLASARKKYHVLCYTLLNTCISQVSVQSVNSQYLGKECMPQTINLTNSYKQNVKPAS